MAQVIRLQRPKCFCGHVAAAIYPKQALKGHRQSPSSSTQGQSNSSQGRRNNPSSSSSAAVTQALTTNWVYECHFTPKQEGMIDPDHCHGCAHDQIEAKEEEARLAKLERERGIDVWRISRAYSTEDIPCHNATMEDFYQLGNGYASCGYLTNDSNPNRKAAGSTGSVWDDEPNDDRTKGKAVDREGRPSQQHFRTVQVSGSQSIPVESIFFSTAKPRPPNGMPLNVWKPAEVTPPPPLSKPSVSQPHALLKVKGSNVAPAPAPAAAFLQQTRSSSPEQTVRWSEDVGVCGFHMHALEWHAMQDRDPQDIITTTQRAQCPVFNLSVTRWFHGELNPMTKQPFNTIECDCGEPMIVSSDLGVRNLLPKGQHYALVCPVAFPPRKNVNGNIVRPVDGHAASGAGSIKRDRWDKRHGSEHHRGVSNERKMKGLHDRKPCGKVIPLAKVVYTPRTDPVHTTIRNDEWLDRWFQPVQPRENYFRKKRLTAKKSILNKKQDRYPVDNSESIHPTRTLVPGKVTFSKQVQVHAPRPEDTESPSGTSSTFHPQLSRSSLPGWGVPQWSDPQIANAILERDLDVWSGPCLSRLKLFNVAVMPKSLVMFSVEEAFQDAKMYAESCGAMWEEQNNAQRKRLAEAQSELEEEQHRHATLVSGIEVMREQGQEMTQVKCKICFERTLTHAVLPCFHLVMCGECSQQVRECIVCRTKIEGLQHIRWG
ncbi:MAG: hypothetical protein J3Q66DRAFT_394228 [Benniella sp.]|nr:MAG: hypothetical protein J3Q66DRAFT_394228 [Benniella sp.]